MEALIVCSLVMILLWTFVANRLASWRITGPLLLVGAGAAVGALVPDQVSAGLNTTVSLQVVELILAVLLFVDATDVHGGLFGDQRGLVARLLFVALPLSVAAAVGLGLLMLPGLPWSVVLVIACVVIPTDFAPGAGLLSRWRLPDLRHLLNVESGYNDGIVSPVFLFALTLAAGSDTGATPQEALGFAIPASLIAVAVGAAVGGVSGWLVRWGTGRGYTTPQSVRIAMVIIPIVTFFAAISLSGNGFVAAFVAGVSYKLTRLGRTGLRGELDPVEATAVDDVGLLTSMVMWFVAGAVGLLVFETGVHWNLIGFALLALTVLRLLPVWLAMWGSRLGWRERTAIGLLGPRGTASVVLGLLAYNELSDDDAYPALYVTTVVVLASLILHGAFGATIAGWLSGPETGAPQEGAAGR